MSDTDIVHVSHKTRNTTFLTASITACEILASSIKDETWHKLVSIFIPVVLGAVSFLIRRGVKSWECNRGINTYKVIILELEQELGNPNITKPRKQSIAKEIEKYKQDIHKLKKDNIKIFID